MTEQEGLTDYRLKAVEERLRSMDHKLDAVIEQNVSRREFMEYQVSQDKRITALEDNQKWVVRSILGVVIGVVLALAFRT